MPIPDFKRWLNDEFYGELRQYAINAKQKKRFEYLHEFRAAFNCSSNVIQIALSEFRMQGIGQASMLSP